MNVTLVQVRGRYGVSQGLRGYYVRDEQAGSVYRLADVAPMLGEDAGALEGNPLACFLAEAWMNAFQARAAAWLAENAELP